jgi:hypothetical protein
LACTFVPSIAITPTLARPASAHKPKTSPNTPANARSWRSTNRRDRRVIPPPMRGDHTTRDIVDAPPLDRPRRPSSTSPAIKQQREHH